MSNPLLTSNTESVASLQLDVVTKIRNQLRNSEMILIQQSNNLMNLVWKNPVLTPQQVCDALGVNAGALIDIGQKTAAYIASIDPAALSRMAQPSFAFTVNSDGTVTVGTTPYVAPTS
jgi:hypothetical protein